VMLLKTGVLLPNDTFLFILHLGRSCRHLKPGNLDKWLVVYEGKQKPIVNELINTLYNVCTPMVKTFFLEKNLH
jgi:hypothetical protein